jgi:hypothetical protein
MSYPNIGNPLSLKEVFQETMTLMPYLVTTTGLTAMGTKIVSMIVSFENSETPNEFLARILYAKVDPG